MEAVIEIEGAIQALDDHDITETEAREFLDKFLEFVESLGYGFGGAIGRVASDEAAS